MASHRSAKKNQEQITLILVDTSIWVSHFRTGNPGLEYLLREGRVLCHPFVIGELALGHLKNRKEIISLIQTLPLAQIAQEDEILQFIESRKLYGSGIGWVDVHLLASALISKAALWTVDANLSKSAAKLDILYTLPQTG